MGSDRESDQNHWPGPNDQPVAVIHDIALFCSLPTGLSIVSGLNGIAPCMSHGLLYDRDEHGEFLRFYTATLGEVFVEVVERRGGYEGFGAPNAPVRLAAQYREFGG